MYSTFKQEYIFIFCVMSSEIIFCPLINFKFCKPYVLTECIIIPNKFSLQVTVRIMIINHRSTQPSIYFHNHKIKDKKKNDIKMCRFSDLQKLNFPDSSMITYSCYIKNAHSSYYNHLTFSKCLFITSKYIVLHY